MAVVFTLVHGTFARNARWTRPASPLVQALLAAFGPDTIIQTYAWNAQNSHIARLQAGAGLSTMLRETATRYPGCRHFLVAHSHGGNVALYALKPETGISLAGIVCLGTPFLTCKPRHVAAVQPVLRWAFSIPFLVLAILYVVLMANVVSGWYRLWQGETGAGIWSALVVLPLLCRAIMTLRPAADRRAVAQFYAEHRKGIRVLLASAASVFLLWSFLIVPPEILAAWTVTGSLSGLAGIAARKLGGRMLRPSWNAAKTKARALIAMFGSRSPAAPVFVAAWKAIDGIALAFLAGTVLAAGELLLDGQIGLAGIAAALTTLVYLAAPVWAGLPGAAYRGWVSFVDRLPLAQSHILERLQLPAHLSSPILAITGNIDEARAHLGLMSWFGNIPFALWNKRTILAIIAAISLFVIGVAAVLLGTGLDLGKGGANFVNWLLALSFVGFLLLTVAIASAILISVATVIGILVAMVVISHATLGAPWGFGVDRFLDHLLVDIRSSAAPPLRFSGTLCRLSLAGGIKRVLPSGWWHSQLCHHDEVIRKIVEWASSGAATDIPSPIASRATATS